MVWYAKGSLFEIRVCILLYKCPFLARINMIGMLHLQIAPSPFPLHNFYVCDVNRCITFQTNVFQHLCFYRTRLSTLFTFYILLFSLFCKGKRSSGLNQCNVWSQLTHLDVFKMLSRERATKHIKYLSLIHI